MTQGPTRHGDADGFVTDDLGTLTSVPGVAVGHWQDFVARTGVTVMTFPEPNVTAVEVRGGAPGTRETALLAPGSRIETINALVFSGGSAFGLASAHGVVERLEAEGRGHQSKAGPVPIVPAAILFDLLEGDPSVRPGAEHGALAYEARSTAPVTQGPVGAGTGASVAGWRDITARQPGGLGSAAIGMGEVTVAALAVVNAVGDVFTLEGESLTGGPPVPGPPAVQPAVAEQTTLVAIATDAALSRTDLLRIIVRSHDALAVCLRPSHTPFDGDVVFAVSCGGRTGDVSGLAEAAFAATGRAIERAIRPAGGVPR